MGRRRKARLLSNPSHVKHCGVHNVPPPLLGAHSDGLDLRCLVCGCEGGGWLQLSRERPKPPLYLTLLVCCSEMAQQKQLAVL